MKQRYFIPLLLVSSSVLMLLYTVLAGTLAAWSFDFMRDEFGIGNLIIVRGFSILAAILAPMIAVPLAVISRKSSSLYGVALAILGLMMVINPMNGEALSMIRSLYPDYLTYTVACWLFWMLGNRLARQREKPQQNDGRISSESALSDELSS
jgi:hypothetical protein